MYIFRLVQHVNKRVYQSHHRENFCTPRANAMNAMVSALSEV